MLTRRRPLRQAATLGRPRAFDVAAALGIALDLFWRQGYKATSLDDLTRAMKLSRSSFYACFGSKHALLIEALTRYCDERVEEFTAIAATESDPARAALGIMRAIAGLPASTTGCMLVNCITELTPSDAEVSALSWRQLERVESVMAGVIGRAGVPPTEAAGRARGLLSTAFGATLFLKTGMSPAHVAAMLADAQRVAFARAPGVTGDDGEARRRRASPAAVRLTV